MIKDIIKALAEIGQATTSTMYGMDMLDNNGKWYRWGADVSLETLEDAARSAKACGHSFRLVRIDKIVTILREEIQHQDAPNANEKLVT